MFIISASFVEEIFWTGTSLKEFHIIESKGNYSVKDLNCPNSPYAFEIIFDKPLQKGEQITFEYEVFAKDPNKTMLPTYVQLIPTKTDSLKISVESESDILENVKTASFAGLEASEEQRVETCDINPDSHCKHAKYTYIPKNICLNYSYAIEWNFKDDNSTNQKQE